MEQSLNTLSKLKERLNKTGQYKLALYIDDIYTRLINSPNEDDMREIIHLIDETPEKFRGLSFLSRCDLISVRCDLFSLIKD